MHKSSHRQCCPSPWAHTQVWNIFIPPSVPANHPSQESREGLSLSTHSILIHSLQPLSPSSRPNSSPNSSLTHGAVYCLASGFSIRFRQKTDFLNQEYPPSGAFSALSRLSRKHPAVQGDIHDHLPSTGFCPPSVFVQHCAPLPGCTTDKAPSCTCWPALTWGSEF